MILVLARGCVKRVKCHPSKLYKGILASFLSAIKIGGSVILIKNETVESFKLCVTVYGLFWLKMNKKIRNIKLVLS